MDNLLALFQFIFITDLGHVLAGGNGGVGDIQGKKELQDAYELDRAIDGNFF